MKKTIKNYRLEGRKVIIRCDFNVPLNSKNKITDYTRIKANLKTIRYAVMKGAKVILLSHLGKVKNDLDRKSNSLYPVAVALSRYLNKDVKFSPDTRGYRLEKMIDELNNGDVLLVENTRFEDICGKKESNCDEELSKYWASLGDIFIEDAYGSCHRKHASVTGIPKYLPSGIGFLIENELNKIDMVLNSDTHPFIVVMGGKKVDDKIVLIKKLLEKCDKLLVGGAMSFTFLKAMGYNVGKSIVSDEHIPFCKKMLEKYSNKIVLPEDFITEKDDVLGNTMIEHFEDDDIGYDIGSKTVNKFKKILSTAKRVILNGPMGMFEEGRFSNGTYLIMKQLSEIKAKTIVGGGDTAAAVNKLGFEKKFYHVSTGGGATMKYLEDGKLIGIEVVLSDNNLKNNCRNKILNGYTVNNMVKIFEDDFENFAKKGSKINPQSVVNKDLYKQYIVMYNQLDIRNYFPQSGGMDSENIELHNYKMTKLKEKLWKNPLWRGMIKFLQVTGIMKVIKKIIKNK